MYLDIGAKADFDYYKSATQDVKFGGAVISHTFKPNVVSTAGEISDFLASSQGEKMYTQEWGFVRQSFYRNQSSSQSELRRSIDWSFC